MKDKTIAYSLWIAFGFVIIAIGYLVFKPMIQDILADTDDTRPVVPPATTTGEAAPSPDVAVTYSL